MVEIRRLHQCILSVLLLEIEVSLSEVGCLKVGIRADFLPFLLARQPPLEPTFGHTTYAGFTSIVAERCHIIEYDVQLHWSFLGTHKHLIARFVCLVPFCELVLSCRSQGLRIFVDDANWFLR